MYNSEDNTEEDTGRILQSEKKEKKTLEVTGSQVVTVPIQTEVCLRKDHQTTK